MRKTKSIVILTILAVLIVVLGTASFASFPIPNSIRDYNSIFSQISKGIDLEGGYYAVLTPEVSEEEADKLDLDSVIQTIRTRLDDKGYTEATITKQDVTSLRVEIPNVDNADEVLEILGSQGKLEFRDSSGTVWLTGDDVEKATKGYDQDGKPCVNLEFTANGQKKFANATETISSSSSDNYLYIYLGDTLVSQPQCKETINSRTASITGLETVEEAENIAAVISSGALSVSFVIGETRQISATLGEGVVNNALIAAGIGLLVIFAILIIFYGGMGVAASVALAVYVILYTIVLALFPWVQLTFPGIAGIILSIGMAVDANVVIFERIKEEYASGKTCTAAIRAGYKRAFITVFDSNVTTVIAAIVLWIFCSGSIQGFAITLFLGVLVSMFTSVVLTRWIMKLFRPLTKNEEKFYGLVRKEATNG